MLLGGLGNKIAGMIFTLFGAKQNKASKVVEAPFSRLALLWSTYISHSILMLFSLLVLADDDDDDGEYAE